VKATWRCLIVATAICSWLAISNHCALGSIANRTESASSCCAFHAKPLKPQPKPAATECCKILRAIFAAQVKNLSPAIVDLVDVDINSGRSSISYQTTISFAPATLDTGPPGTTSFAELTGSVQSHAPPR
jgi:hypothetical protein